MTSATDNRTTELEQSKYKPPYDARPMRMLRHHIECDCLASRRGVLREIEDLFAIELKKRDERIAELEQAIAATLSDDEYEAKMDALLCRLTNGKWSKSRAYDLDFMVSCVDEEYEDAYEKEHAELWSGTLTAKQVREAIKANAYSETSTTFEFESSSWQAIADELNAELGSGTCEPNWVLQGKTQTQEFWRCECGNCGECFGVEDRSSFPFKMTIDKVDVPNFCPNCGKAVKR